MEITRIEKENLRYFLPLLPKDPGYYDRNMILFGVIDEFGNVSGAMAARIYGDFVDIISLYILPEQRRQGYASALIEKTEGILKDSNFAAMTAEINYDRASQAFCDAMGFELFEGRVRHYFSLKEFLRSPLYRKMIAGRKVKKVRAASSLSPEEKKLLKTRMNFSDFDPVWSTVRIKRGRVKSCLFAKRDEKNINISYLYSESEDPMEFLQHIRALVFKTMDVFPEQDAVFRMNFERDEIVKSFEELLGGKEHLHKEGQFYRAVKLI